MLVSDFYIQNITFTTTASISVLRTKVLEGVGVQLLLCDFKHFKNLIFIKLLLFMSGGGSDPLIPPVSTPLGYVHVHSRAALDISTLVFII